jgi:hypothetical protein
MIFEAFVMRAFFILIIFLASCGIDDTKKPGMHKNSQSIEESKGNGVFNFELHIDNPIVNTGNNNTDTIQEAWVENMWMYNDKGNIVKDSTLQIVMLLKNPSKYPYPEMDIWFKQNGRYLEWNGVCVGTYQSSDSIIYLTKKENGQEIVLDTIAYSKYE